MISKEMNERLTQTGAGTPGGEWLRRYWWPIAAVSELKTEPVQPVRLLGEDLTLFQSGRGDVGLIGERCAHRAISLAYGIPQENGLRCAYHGWTYDTAGHVVDMPFEPACLPLKVKAYPVEVLGGLVWAYLGPEPRPLLPRWEGVARSDIDRTVSFKPLPCNWVQCMDNSMDPVHFEHLHGYYGDYYNRKHGIEQRLRTARHLKIEFDLFEYGVYKRRLIEGDPEDADDWVVGHPIIFPYILVVGPGVSFSYQMRVPIDDTHTMHTVLAGKPRDPDQTLQDEVPARREHVKYDERGRVNAPWIVLQDEMAWIGQGSVSDRSQEHLATSDKGVILYHNLILENIEKVQRGEDPLGMIRDPEKNFPHVSFRRERASHKMTRSGVSDPRSDRFAWAASAAPAAESRG
ncbi:MAG: Rieske 2Fe-2S domain-containing protein [Chloroflexi bacterium]|nr:Rieske 2Fe-2S domain-containing protein [Chloroflexota bacterium]